LRATSSTRPVLSGNEAVFLIMRAETGDRYEPPPRYRRMTTFHTLIIYELTAAANPSLRPGYELVRYLDRFFLVLPVDRVTERQDTLDLFFSWLAPQYELAIDVVRNIKNIENLLALLQLPARAIVLDFGCGTGLAHDAAKSTDITLVGFDTCDVMRGIASVKGMRTITPELLFADDFLVDAIVASYVVHLRPAAAWVEAAWKHLRVGGAFVCNIHKSTGLPEFVHMMKSLGAAVTIHDDSTHGPYIVCQKAFNAIAA
jgi:SAM-dependent methyltransferase